MRYGLICSSLAIVRSKCSEAYIVVETSGALVADDLIHVRRRAGLLTKAPGVPCIALAIGGSESEDNIIKWLAH